MSNRRYPHGLIWLDRGLLYVGALLAATAGYGLWFLVVKVIGRNFG